MYCIVPSWNKHIGSEYEKVGKKSYTRTRNIISRCQRWTERPLGTHHCRKSKRTRGELGKEARGIYDGKNERTRGELGEKARGKYEFVTRTDEIVVG